MSEPSIRGIDSKGGLSIGGKPLTKRRAAKMVSCLSRNAVNVCEFWLRYV